MKNKKRLLPSLSFPSSLRALALLVLLGVGGSLACSAPQVSLFSLLATPTPVPEPTPLGDSLYLTVPAFAARLQPGETLPGTQLAYIGPVEGGYQVSIDGQVGTKRTGDSFFWSGIVAPGVYGNYRLRLTTSLFGALPVAGPVELVVLFPDPQEASNAAPPDALHFSNIVLDYRVPVNRVVPGTTLVFEGVEEQGLGDERARLARFGGLAGYNKLAVGDSLVWKGHLRDNVWVSYGMRVLSLEEDSIHLLGTGDLWMTK